MSIACIVYSSQLPVIDPIGGMGVQLVFTVSDMACSACADKIDRAIHAIDPHAIVTANPQTKLVQIETASPADAIAQAISDAGYTVSQ